MPPIYTLFLEFLTLLGIMALACALPIFGAALMGTL